MKLSWLIPLTLGGFSVPFGAWLKQSQSPPPNLHGSPAIQSGNSVSIPVAPVAKPSKPPRPRLEELLASEGHEQLRLLARFLPDAPLEEILKLTHLPKPGDIQYYGDEKRHAEYAWKLILARWSMLDAEGALEYVRASKPPMERYDHWCYRAWSTADPLAALQAARRHPDKYLAEVIHSVIKHDLDTAISIMESFPDNDAVQNAVFAALGERNATTALARALGLEGHRQAEAIEAVMAGISKDDIREALALALELTESDHREKALAVVLPKLIKVDPETAERHLVSLRHGSSRYGLMKKLAVQRVKDDPNRALEWARRLTDHGERRAALATVFKVAAREGSVEERLALIEAMGYEEAVPNPREISRMGYGSTYRHGGDLRHQFEDLVKEQAQIDPEAALKTLANFPPRLGDSSFHPRDDLFESLAEEWLQGEHRETFVSMLDRIPDTSVRRKMFDAAMKGAPPEAYPELAAQSAQWEEGDFANTATGSLAEAWLKEDALAASTWIGSLEPGQAKDNAIRTLIASLKNVGLTKDHEAVFAWSQSYSDEKTRHEAIWQAYEEWKDVDSEGGAPLHRRERPRKHSRARTTGRREQTVNRLVFFSTGAVVLGFAIGWFWPVADGRQPENEGETNNLLVLNRSLSNIQSPPPAWLASLQDQEDDVVSRLFTLLGSEGGGDIPAVLEAISEIENYAERRMALVALLEPWATRDPEAAFAQCAALADPNMRQQSLGELVSLLAPLNEALALELVDSLESDPIYTDLQIRLIEGLCQANPATAAEQALSRGLEKQGYRYIRKVFSSYAKQDPASAIEHALRFESSSAIDVVFEVWATSDPAAALDYLSKHTDAFQEHLREPYERVAVGLTKEDPDAAMEWALGLIDTGFKEKVRQWVMKAIGESLAEDDPAQALAFLEISNTEAYYKAIVRAYAKNDWESARTFTLDVQEGSQREAALRGLAEALAERPTEEIEGSIEGLLGDLAAEEQHIQVYNLLRNLGHDVVLDLLQRYPDQLEDSIDAWADRVRSESPANAIPIIDSITNARIKKQVVDRALGEWARQDPRQAADWIASQPLGDVRDSGYKHLVNAWARYDPVAARRWIESQPDSRSRDIAAKELASLQAAGNPKNALTIAQSINDESLRSNATRDALEGWLWKDAESAQDAMANLTLSDEEEAHLKRKAEEFAAWSRLAEE